MGLIIENGILKKYVEEPNTTDVVIPDGVTAIGEKAFFNCTGLTSISIPDSVTSIGDEAFNNCTGLMSITIPDSVKSIGHGAFYHCTGLTLITIPDGVKCIGEGAFQYCKGLTSITIPEGVTSIGQGMFYSCTGLMSITIPEGVTSIEKWAFRACTGLTSITIPDSVTSIGEGAFRDCTGLTSITIPDSVTSIGLAAFHGTKWYNSRPDGMVYCGKVLCTCKGEMPEKTAIKVKDDTTIIEAYAFSGCKNMTSVLIPSSVKRIKHSAFDGCTGLISIEIQNGVTSIEDSAFSQCTSLTSITIPGSVTHIGRWAFSGCQKNTIICTEGTYAHKYVTDNLLPFLFDYQFRAFKGVVPPGIQQLASPFVADEEQPFVFISYSHKDRDAVLKVIKPLYESGWRIWYDEGLTIGDSYDETLEEHIKNCSAFLLFSTENSCHSQYIQKNEIPWALRYHKPIIKCILADSEESSIDASSCFAFASSPSEIEAILARVPNLTKGEAREAKGITVAVDINAREVSSGDGFAYCLYSPLSAEKASAILLEAKKNGCRIYDAVKDGEAEEKLQNAASLIVFLDKTFLSDSHLTQVLSDEYQKGTDLVICQTEDFENEAMPEHLRSLWHIHWLVFTHAITADMLKNLAIHLQKQGCRNTAILPGFDYEKTDGAIIIKRYTGMEPAVQIEREYGGVPVKKIDTSAFENCIHLEKVILPDSLEDIAAQSFTGCVSLTSIAIPDSVTTIEVAAFQSCTALTSITFPAGITTIEPHTFQACTNLLSIAIPNGVSSIGKWAFSECISLTSLAFPDSVTSIGEWAFSYCTGLTSVSIPNGVESIGNLAFRGCKKLTSISIPNSVIRIGNDAFERCTNLTIHAPEGSYAARYAKEHGIPFVAE